MVILTVKIFAYIAAVLQPVLLIVLLLILTSQIFSDLKLGVTSNTVMVLEDHFRKIVEVYAAKSVTYAQALSNNRTGLNSIGVKEFGVPGIQVQNYPADIAIDSKTNKIYVVNYYSNTVSVIDGKSNVVLANLTIGTFPQKVVVSSDTDRIYIDEHFPLPNSTLVAMDGYTNIVVNKLTISPSSSNYMAVGPFDIIYMTMQGSNKLKVIDGPTLTSQIKLTLGAASDNLRGVTVDSNSNKIFVVNGGDNHNSSSHSSLIVIQGPKGLNSGEGFGPVANVPIALASDDDSEDVAINPNTGVIYVIDRSHDRVHVIDGIDYHFLGNIPVGRIPEGIAVNVKMNKIYVQNMGDDTVSVIDGKTNSVKTIKASDHLQGPYANVLPINGISVNPNTDESYVPNPFFGKVTVIDGQTDKVQARIHFKSNPSNAGDIQCNTSKISGNIYMMYDLGTRLTCQAKENDGFISGSWSGDISPSLDDDSLKTFNITNYGSLTANFNPAPPSITIPPDLLYGVILGPIVGAIVGWLIPITIARLGHK